MHKSSKKAVVITLLSIGLFSAVIFLNSCTRTINNYIKNTMPCGQPGTTWCTEDGRIEFSIVETSVPEHEVLISDGITRQVMAYHWIHGEGTIITGDNIILEIVYEEESLNNRHISIRSECGTIEETWIAVYLKEDFVAFKAEKSAIYSTGEIIRLYRQVIDEQPGVTWRSEDDRFQYSVIDVIKPEHTVKMSDDYMLRVNAYKWNRYEGSFLSAGNQRVSIIVKTGLGDSIIVYSIKQTNDSSSVEFLERWHVKHKCTEYVDVEVESSSIYDQGFSFRILRTSPENYT